MSNLPTVEIPPVPADLPIAPEPPRRHRALWIVLVAAISALIVAVPLGLMLALRGDGGNSGAAVTGAAGGSGSVANPAAPATAAPGTAAPGTGAPKAVAPSAAAPARPAASDGRIPADVLRNATLTIPPWPTDNLTGRSGPVKFTNGQAVSPPDKAFPFERYLIIASIRYGDVDRDGAQETVAVIACWVQGGSEQVVAFDRDARGRIVTLGTVVSTTGPLRTVDVNSVKVLSGGTVSIRVGDFEACCGDETPVIWQTRRYGWTGTRFRQTGGPTWFPVNPHVTETAVSARSLVFGPAIAGTRHGTLTVTVRYRYGVKPIRLGLTFWVPPDVAREGKSWPAVHTEPYGTFTIYLPTPALGSSRTYTFRFSRPAAGSGGDFGLYLFGVSKKDPMLAESYRTNNFTGQIAVVTKD